MSYLPRLASNGDPPDLCLLSSWDYRREPQCPTLPCSIFLLLFFFSSFPLQGTGFSLLIFALPGVHCHKADCLTPAQAVLGFMILDKLCLGNRCATSDPVISRIILSTC
jgi:hypothetical protein